MTADPALIADLADVVGSEHCLTEAALTAGFTRDFTGRFGGEAAAVVRPADGTEVAAVLAAASRHGAVVIPQGGNSGLVGGAVPRRAYLDGGDVRPEVIVVTTRMRHLRLDRATRLLEAGSGATLASAESTAAAAGLQLGIDLAARDSATLGGMASTNAGGLNVVRYGPMRSRLAGLEAVLNDGSVVEQMSGLVKDSAGWDLTSLFAGAEGTLGVITRVLVRLEPVPAERVVALVAVHDLSAAISLVLDVIPRLQGIEAAELTLRDGMELVCESFRLPPPVGLAAGANAWLTLEVAGARDPTEEMAKALEDSRVLDVAVGSATTERERLWSYRERHTDAVARLGLAHKLDVALPGGRLEEFLASLPEILEPIPRPCRLVVWGHVAEGNMHVNVVGPDASDEAVDDAILGRVLELGGSIAAEHGVGVAKARWLARARSAGTLEAMARVKDAFDPDRLLNPGVLDPARAWCFAPA